MALVEAEVERLEQDTPPPPSGPERLVLGADGAMVPLVRGEWAEVKLLTLGEPCPCRAAVAETEPTTNRTERLSYFARLADAETFGRQALVELHRRGLETAGAVAAVQDGAPWLQSFVAFHRPDALRILDWPHAAQRLTAITEQLFGVQSPRSQRVADRLRRWLWTQGPQRVLAVLTAWESAAPAIAGDVAYLRFAGRAPGPVGLSHLSGAGLAGGQWRDRERPQDRDASPPEARRHATSRAPTSILSSRSGCWNATDAGRARGQGS